MNDKQKILIDTDIGDDIDDAFALLSAMALDFEIVGITTVFRDTDRRARMVKKLLRAFGNGYENVPVYAGYATYSEDNEINNENHGYFAEELMSDAYTPNSTDPEEAVDFIIDSCRKFGDQLTVIALGPFCNLAKALEKAPDSLNEAGRVVIMGGAFYKQYADWNVMCDVPAADLMFRSLNKLVCIGADVTHRLFSDRLIPEITDPTQPCSPVLACIRELYRDWRKAHPNRTLLLHDVLVIYYVFDPGICTMERIRATVITHGFAKGLTLNVDAYNKASLNSAYLNNAALCHTLVAADVDLEKFSQFVRRDIDRCLQLLP